MTTLENRWKKIIIPWLCGTAVSIGAAVLIALFFFSNAADEANLETAALLETIRAHYPDVTDRELLAILAEAEKNAISSAGGVAKRNILERLGYQRGVFYARRLQRAVLYLAGSLIAVSGFSAVLFLVLALLKEKKQEKEIETLIDSMHAIQRGVYDLHPEKEEEGALSRLSNELYKVMAHLRESAEKSGQEKEALSRALADISHQLKTPLASIRILLDNIADDPEMDPATRTEFLTSISHQTDRIGQLVVTLLHLAQLDSGTITMHRAEVTALDLLTEVIRSLQILLEVQEVSVRLEGDTGAVLTVDRKWQKEALMNILKNGAEHSPRGSEILVRVEEAAIFTVITIRDAGEGIPKNELGHIFDRFYKGKGTKKESIGIGLAFARTVIEKEGGIITADSEVGKGTTFTIRYRKEPY